MTPGKLLVAELVEEGFIKESGYASSTGGRRPQMYALIPGKIFVISVAMDQLVTKIGIIDIYSSNVENVEKFDLPLIQNANALNELTNYIKE